MDRVKHTLSAARRRREAQLPMKENQADNSFILCAVRHTTEEDSGFQEASAERFPPYMFGSGALFKSLRENVHVHVHLLNMIRRSVRCVRTLEFTQTAARTGRPLVFIQAVFQVCPREPDRILVRFILTFSHELNDFFWGFHPTADACSEGEAHFSKDALVRLK